MIPAVTLTIQDGGLGQVPASFADSSVKMGICSGGTPNVLSAFGDITTAQAGLGQGPLIEALADTLAVAGGPIFAMPINPSAVGTVSSTNTSLVTGAATVTGSSAPAQSIAVKIATGGALGTMTFQVSLNGGAYGAIVTSTITSFSYLVPGTLTTLTFAAQTYTTAAVWTFSVLGGVSLSGTGTVGWITQVSSPLDGYDVRVAIVNGGALGVGVFTYSVDGNNNVSAQVLIPSGGAFAIPSTGVVLTFSGTFVALDAYSLTTTTAGFSSSDASAALTALQNQPALFAWVHITGAGANAAAALTLAGAVDSAMTIALVSQRFIFCIIECPTSEADSVLASTFANFSSLRVLVGAGDIAHVSSANQARVIRRNVAVVGATRLSAIDPRVHPGKLLGPPGALSNVSSLYPNGTSTSWLPDTLDANRFMTARKFAKRPGYYITRAPMMAPGGSDFAEVMNRRVMDTISTTAVDELLNFLNDDLQLNQDGTIYEAQAQIIESAVGGVLNAAHVPNDATKIKVTISRTQNIRVTRTMPTAIAVTPYGYANFIKILMGFINPSF